MSIAKGPRYGPARADGPKIKNAVDRLTVAQKELYDALMLNRTGNLREARVDALLMVETATRRNALDEELRYWTD